METALSSTRGPFRGLFGADLGEKRGSDCGAGNSGWPTRPVSRRSRRLPHGRGKAFLEATADAMSGLLGSVTSFGVSVPRSARRVAMLWTGNPSGCDRSPSVCPGLCAARDLRGFHRRAPLRSRALAFVVREQDRRQALTHVPFHVGRKYAQEHIGKHQKPWGFHALWRRRSRDPPSNSMVLRCGLRQLLLGGVVE